MDRPILMSAPMVRAIWDGRKSQTRRIINPQPPSGANLVGIYAPDDFKVRLRFVPGDRLWVREAWRCNGWAIDKATIFYRANEGDGYTAMCEQYPVAGKKPLRVTATWRPGIHMPRWASRLTLVVTAVKVERLTEISDEDAKAEGIYPRSAIGDDPTSSEWTWQKTGWRYDTPRDAYKALWTEINGPGSWESNPWVAAISFVAHKANIDAMKEAG